MILSFDEGGFSFIPASSNYSGGSGGYGRFGGGWYGRTKYDNLGGASNGYTGASNVQPPRDPLIIDLGREGIELTTVEDGVYFDLDKNGFAEKTAWIGKEDGFLFLDRYGKTVHL